ncbi:MAG: ABC transporter substrate-binding protein, partial [Leptolyngbyaceae bacterium]|nr:ABC transporter substrate-binding protein [Leptolyngbyaceae bacterium]
MACLIAIKFLWGVPGATQQPVTLSLLMVSPEVPLWQPLIKNFEAENPDIRINLVEGPSSPDSLEDLYTSAFLLGGSPYDLVYMDVTWAPKFAAAGWLVNLDRQFSASELAEFLPGNLNGGRYEGGLYRIPFRSDVGVLYYRRDLLEQAGYKPPETFTELVQISQSLQKQGAAKWGYLWQGRQYEGSAAMFVEILEGFGGFWLNPDTREVGLNQPAAIQAVEFLRSTIEQGISPPGVVTYREEDTRYLFQAGEAVFLRNWPYVWPLANGDDSPVKGKIALKPMVHSSGYSSGACQGGWGLGIAKTSPYPDQSLKAVKFLTNAASQRQFSLANGYLPSRRSLFLDPQIVAKYNY